MTTNTDLANHALALLGEMPISDIDSETSKPARVCLQFVQAAIDETLRMGRWNCATERVTLAKSTVGPVAGYDFYYDLPGDFIRLMEVNGEQWEDSSEFFEIEGLQLATDEDSVSIRYIQRIPIGFADALLANAIAIRLAGKIALPLTGSEEKAITFARLFREALGEARQHDAQESGTGRNPRWAKVFSRSRLLRSRGSGRNPETYQLPT